MSATAFHSEDSPRSHERRRFVRQRVRSLAYLDVVPNNGGIVLNLSENGLALQAVNPFDETRVSLRIQPPKSRRRIEASAEITWLSESKTQAGLQFLELSEEARLEIADWVADESGLAEQRPLSDLPAVPTQQIPSNRATPESPRMREKWSAMLADSAPQQTLEDQQPPEYPVSSEVQRDDVRLQPDVARGRKSPNTANEYPSFQCQCDPPDDNQRKVKPVNALAPSASVSRVLEFPTATTAGACSQRFAPRTIVTGSRRGHKQRYSSSQRGGSSGECGIAKASRASIPEAVGHRGALGLCRCYFLFVGLAIIRQRPLAGYAKLAAHGSGSSPCRARHPSPPRSRAPHHASTRSAARRGRNRELASPRRL